MKHAKKLVVAHLIKEEDENYWRRSLSSRLNTVNGLTFAVENQVAMVFKNLKYQREMMNDYAEDNGR